ncbi:unnamed protein product [Kluyveromyces dobzhanskii CBS 2104]|uniref:WGS project CCBQ000000000 data, contig 00011 n=1 Tax=Kluyveromyces dobzhanskii CBS 2104 TaxID=1427455 RepID=A0A0A8L9M5_9SACH|nr:unnamed protein product [Kluyveromyces dobzhanskii CBS 2104]
MPNYELLCFGSNGNGQLGVGHDDDLILPQISFQSAGAGIKKVACGGNHSLLLLEDGSLYWSGENTSGQCDSSGTKRSFNWVRLPGNFLDVACGWEVTVVVDSDGWVRTRGRGDKGELGVPQLKRSDEWMYLFQCVDPGAAQCYATFQHCLVVVPEKIYGWGNNRKLQVCEDSSSKIIDTPTVVYEGDTANTIVALGKDFTCIINKNENRMKLMGPLAKEIPKITSGLPNGVKSIVTADSMWSSLHILNDEKRLISVGRGLHGQFLEGSLPSDVVKFVTGSEHGIIVTKKMEVLCWGWGEHGNCGSLNSKETNHINDKSNVISPINLIGKYDNVSKIFGGCATTWIVLQHEA